MLLHFYVFVLNLDMGYTAEVGRYGAWGHIVLVLLQ